MTKFDVENPSTGEVIKTYAFTEEAEIHHKIERAYEAYLSCVKSMRMNVHVYYGNGQL